MGNGSLFVVEKVRDYTRISFRCARMYCTCEILIDTIQTLRTRATNICFEFSVVPNQFSHPWLKTMADRLLVSSFNTLIHDASEWLATLKMKLIENKFVLCLYGGGCTFLYQMNSFFYIRKPMNWFALYSPSRIFSLHFRKPNHFIRNWIAMGAIVHSFSR